MKKTIKIIIVIYYILYVYSVLKIKSFSYTILQIDRPTVQKINNTINNKSPTFIMNILSEWKEIMSYNLNYWKSYNLHLPINVVKYDNQYIFSKMPLSRFLSHSENLEECYFVYDNDITMNGIHNMLYSYCKDFCSKLAFNKKTSLIWIPPKCNSALFQNTSLRTFLFCIQGKTRVFLFHPKHSKNMYRSQNRDKFVQYSLLHPENSNLKKYPLFKNSNYIELIVSPGQILYIPYKWWFYMKPISEDSISLLYQELSMIIPFAQYL